MFRKAGGGVKFNATCPLTQLGDNPQDTVGRILHSYRIHNAEVLVREDVSVDDFIDVIESNRKVRCPRVSFLCLLRCLICDTIVTVVDMA